MKKPDLKVPADIFLALARAYKCQPQELCERDQYMIVDQLEHRAVRKWAEFRKAVKNE